MDTKITWGDVYKDFKSKHPRLCKNVRDYRPYAYLQIIIYFTDGTQMIYDYMSHQGTWNT